MLEWPAAQVAELLGTTTTAVNSGLRRARAQLARVLPADDELAEPAEPDRLALLERFAAAIENGDAGALAELFQGRSQLLVYHFMFGPSYGAGDPVNSSVADTLDTQAPHLQARDVTLLLVSQAPLATLQAYKRRMGWRLGWVSAAPSDFNLDYGASTPPGKAIVPPQDGLPPIVAQNAAAAGTDIAGYLTEAPVVSVFVLQDEVVYQSYTSTWRGVEFLMGYYPVLDRVPKGRDEDDNWQLWLRRHDEYVQGLLNVAWCLARLAEQAL